VVLTARRAAALTDVARNVPGALVVAADLTVEDQRQRLVDDVMQHHGRIDVLIYNAGAAASFTGQHPHNECACRGGDRRRTSRNESLCATPLPESKMRSSPRGLFVLIAPNPNGAAGPGSEA